jgi:hypothetical protein
MDRLSRNVHFITGLLEAGVNLASEFPQGPLKPAFDQIWKAVGEKQAFETRQIKTLFRSPEAKKDMEAIVKSSELEHVKLVAALKAAYAPAETSLVIEEVR